MTTHDTALHDLVAATESDFRPDPDGSVEAGISVNRTFPSNWYSSQEIFDLEQRLIFRRAWDYVGHRGQVSRPGDYFTCVSAGVPIVVVRGKDGQVRAFLNICRHRQNSLMQGAGHTRMIVCQYHSWSYKLDGCFNAAPRSSEDAEFDGSKLSLLPVGIDFLGNMIFVNPSGDAPSLSEALGPIPHQAREKGYPLDTAVFRQVRELEVDANWKVSWDNNSECYHCPTVHRSWYREANLSPDNISSFPIGPLQFQHVMKTRDDSPTDNHYFCWPTFTLATDASSGPGFADRAQALMASSPGGDLTHHGYFIWRRVPLAPDRTRIEFHLYTTDLTDEAAIDAWFSALFSVMDEDKAICESVQRCHSAGVGEPGTLIPAIDSEYQTKIWSQLVHRAVTQPNTPLYAPFMDAASTWPEKH